TPYTLSLHDALPILATKGAKRLRRMAGAISSSTKRTRMPRDAMSAAKYAPRKVLPRFGAAMKSEKPPSITNGCKWKAISLLHFRSEEHTSELQSPDQ